MGVGAGFVNGDAVVYAHQAMTGDLASRITHIGYILPVHVLAWIAGANTPILMDLLSALAAGFAFICAAKISMKVGGDPKAVAGLTFVGVLPLACSAEVDIIWFTLLLYATVTTRRRAIVFSCWAVAVSPMAIAALPWAMVIRSAVHARRSRLSAFDIGFGALLGVSVLSVLSSGDWWFGQRGVLVATDVFEYKEVVHRWTHGVGLTYVAICAVCLVNYKRVLAPSLWISVVLSLTMLASPPDTAGYIPLLVSLALLAGFSRHSMRFLTAGLIIISMLLAVGEWSRRVARVEAEDALVRHVAQRLADEDGLVATWSWGVRVSWYREGSPYGAWWRVPGAALPQQLLWCQKSFLRTASLPAGRDYDNRVQWTVDEFGVSWSPLSLGQQNTHPLCVN